MYQIAICDDQQTAIKALENYINNYSILNNKAFHSKQYNQAIDLLYDVEEGVCFDIIFVDIEMSELNGLETIKRIKQLHSKSLIIIVSSYTQYAIEAIELEVFRYLVKSDLDSSFDLAMRTALKRIDLINSKNYYIISPRKHIKIACNEIIYCYKESKSSVIVTFKDQIKERKALHTLLEDLNSISNNYIMIERGYIVNLHYVTKIDKNNVILENNTILPIGYTYLDKVKKHVITFWSSKL